MNSHEIFRVFKYAAEVAGCNPEELTLVLDNGREVTRAQALAQFGYDPKGRKKAARYPSVKAENRLTMQKRVAELKAKRAR